MTKAIGYLLGIVFLFVKHYKSPEVLAQKVLEYAIDASAEFDDNLREAIHGKDSVKVALTERDLRRRLHVKLLRSSSYYQSKREADSNGS